MAHICFLTGVATHFEKKSVSLYETWKEEKSNDTCQ